NGKGDGDVILLDGVETPTEVMPLVDEAFEAIRSHGAGIHVVSTFTAAGISASPSEENMHYFNIMILGLAQSPYEAAGISASPSEENMRYFNIMILGLAQSPYE
ncbi:hypothetical protein ABZP36_030339, partial [Zizania latifolia]